MSAPCPVLPTPRHFRPLPASCRRHPGALPAPTPRPGSGAWRRRRALRAGAVRSAPAWSAPANRPLPAIRPAKRRLLRATARSRPRSECQNRRTAVQRPSTRARPWEAVPVVQSGARPPAPPPDLRCRLVVTFARLVDLVGTLARPLATILSMQMDGPVDHDLPCASYGKYV